MVWARLFENYWIFTLRKDAPRRLFAEILHDCCQFTAVYFGNGSHDLLWPRHKPRHTWLSWLTFAPLRFGIASEALGQTRRHEKNIIPLACNICVLFICVLFFSLLLFVLFPLIFFLSMYTVYFFVIYREITKFRLSAG